MRPLIAVLAAAGLSAVAYRLGTVRERARGRDHVTPHAARRVGKAIDATSGSALVHERARLLRSYEAEAAGLRRTVLTLSGLLAHARSLERERHVAFRALADARDALARYRQLLQDIERDGASPVLGSASGPDDLKLIVGIGPVLERMLHALGITTYREIARWTERDIDAFDMRLPEFHGRIRRDRWVVQARELHQRKYGHAPTRERG